MIVFFWISETSGNENDFLYMAESTNIPEIKTDSLMYYLTEEEFLSAEKLTFKNFGKIHSSKQFDIYVLLKTGSDIGRDYTFILRTSNNYKIIDSYNLNLAIWCLGKERVSKFCTTHSSAVNCRSAICDKYVLFDILKKSHETQISATNKKST